jgi:rhamnogalacturonan endolyase
MQREKLGRGVVAVRSSADSVFISWRYLECDPENIAFDIYRNEKKLNIQPVIQTTYWYDKYTGTGEAEYRVIPTITGCPAAKTILPVNAPVGYINIPLQKPEGGITPDEKTYSYSANDASIGDVNGDGEYELFLKWDPTNAHDNAHDGYTGPVFIDCINLKGELLWRINLGKNIRAGAHYTQFMVYDLNGDDKAEIVVKTSDGTMDGQGNVIGDAQADHRSPKGHILSGAEYLTVFDGETGREIHTIPYVPQRGDPMSWGDNEANRSERYLACIAYLDGIHPTVVMCRGYYTRSVLAAFDFKDGKLTQRWVFDTQKTEWKDYAGQGNHNLRVGDVDGDGCDEIIYGQMAVNNDGTGLYTTRMGHGDALHLTAFFPDDRRLQIWSCHENKRDGTTLRDAATGKVLVQVKSPIDVGRCMAADIDSTHNGVEMWSWESGGLLSAKGKVITTNIKNFSVNMGIWWDGDLCRELLDKNHIQKYDSDKKQCYIYHTFERAVSNNGTKATPAIQGDLVGDWREEVLLRTPDNNSLRLYISTEPTRYRFHTFLHDPVYRISLATQNVAYNQPTQPGFYFGPNLSGFFRGTWINKKRRCSPKILYLRQSNSTNYFINNTKKNQAGRINLLSNVRYRFRQRAIPFVKVSL